MKAIELTGLEGFQSMRVVEADKPKPGPNQVLIDVKTAGINFAELELTKGKYPALKPLPYIVGLEAAGIVAELVASKERQGRRQDHSHRFERRIR